MGDKIKAIRNPAVWTVITLVLAGFGLPPAVSTALGALIDLTPVIFDHGATVAAAGVTLWESWRSKQALDRIKESA